jgi:hypothetical protein
VLNPKKGAGMTSFSNVNTALKSARLSWTYNWWYDLSWVRTTSAANSFPFVVLVTVANKLTNG